MRLGTLLDTQELGLTLLVGADALDREFARVFTSTLYDPTRYLTGGELVLCGMRWLPGPEDADVFVGRLVRAGVVALGAGTAEVEGPVPDHMVASCRRAGLPLIEVPDSVSFATVSERVILGMAAERARADPHRRLVAVVTDGGGLDALVEAGAAALGADCWVLSASGRVIAASGPAPEPELAASLARRFLLAGRLPLETSGFVLYDAARTGHRVASWCLAVRGSRPDDETAEELAALVGLERSRVDDTQRIENRAAVPLLRLALSEEAGSAEMASRLAAAGFSPEDQVVVVSAMVHGGGPGLAPLIVAELVALYPALVGTVDGETFGLARCADFATFTAQLRESVRVLEPSLGDARLSVGLSRAPDLRGAVQEARHASRLATGRAGVVAGDEVASHLLLLAAVPEELRRGFGEKVLGPLISYDAAHNSELVRTLKVFLEYSGSWTQTAAALHLHVNTLRYRVSRISELTGRDPGRFADRVDLYLAGCFAQRW